MIAGRSGQLERCAARCPTRIEPAPEWQGSFDEARRLVDTFAPRLSFNDRERLAALVQYSAEWTWADSLEVAPQIAFARTG